jgi:hypothetical protein
MSPWPIIPSGCTSPANLPYAWLRAKSRESAERWAAIARECPRVTRARTRHIRGRMVGSQVVSQEGYLVELWLSAAMAK